MSCDNDSTFKSTCITIAIVFLVLIAGMIIR